ncbi:uncharacterized protein BDW43DRAFT_293030 [Aspergillus alliaceus]|uniref:uncharacterized protein n=1 Tax=Petromyces alliaceus TaxID=209559 RepID=UPI0012A40788|nr:uncharacterized protein BDW43DRAFT_293030 [Aspergillus alliaceus]KAB8227781.1 hypothetical protein BDW43DRAFT_293030 [Aspergillus alliaceus]
MCMAPGALLVRAIESLTTKRCSGKLVYEVAGMPPSLLLIFGLSMGTAVSTAVSRHLALRSPPVVFAGGRSCRSIC